MKKVMYCVIQEVPVKKVSCGEAKEILVDKMTFTMDGVTMMLSRLVDTFFSRTSWTMLLYAENHSISVA